MGKEIDIEDEKFEALLQEKRHKELTKNLRDLFVAISTKDDKSIIDAINGQGEKIGELVTAIQSIPKPEKIGALVSAIQNIPKPEKPQINVEVKQDLLISSVQQICKNIIESNNKVIEAVENRLLPDTFELIKNYGVTQSVKVNYKPANQIKK